MGSPVAKEVYVRYHADITAGSLKVPESRVIAGLLLSDLSEHDWASALYDQNVLQVRNPETATRFARLLRLRLQTMDDRLWQMISDGSFTVATHACLAAAVKHSALLGDFLDLVMREQYRLYNKNLLPAVWERYIDDCQARDSDMPIWSESTIRRLRSSVFQILAQAGYIDSTRTLKLQTVHISQEVLSYLHAHDEDYVLRCVQVSP